MKYKNIYIHKARGWRRTQCLSRLLRSQSLSLVVGNEDAVARLPYFLKINFTRLVAPVYLGSKFGPVLALARRSRKRGNGSARLPAARELLPLLPSP